MRGSNRTARRRLGGSDLAALAAAIPPGAAAGTRYPAGGMAGVFV